MGVWKTIALFLWTLVVPKYHLALENLGFRQQLAVYQQSIKRPRLRPRDRVFWVWLSQIVARLALHTGYRKARNGRPMAPAGIQALLALEISDQKSGPTQNRRRSSRTHSPHVARESDLGRTTDSIGTYSVGIRGRRENRRQVHGAHAKAAFPELENVFGQSPDRTGSHRLFYSADCDIPCALLFRGPAAT